MDAIYVRQSIFKKDSISLDQQIEYCQQKVSPDAGEPAIYKESRSGKNIDDRPVFRQLLEDIKSGKIRKVIVYKLDRISRSVADFSNIWKLFESYEVEFVSCNENFDTSTPMGKAMLYISIVFAEMERSTIAERITDNYFARAKEGFYLGGYAPFGFNKIEIVHMGKRTAAYEADQTLSPLINNMFRDYAKTNISIGKLALRLNEQGAKTPRGGNWTSSSLGRVLRSPLYVKADSRVYNYLKKKGATMNNAVEDYVGTNGCYIYAPMKAPAPGNTKRISTRRASDLSTAYITLAPHTGIVSPQLWLEAQYKLDNNKQIKCDRSGTHTWMSGIMRCRNCGYGVFVVNNNRGRFYVNCYGKKKHECRGREKVWHLNEIEDLARIALLNRLQSLQGAQGMPIDEEENEEVLHLEAQQANLDERIERLLDELEQSPSSRVQDRIHERINQLTNEYESIRRMIAKLQFNRNNKKNLSQQEVSVDDVLEHWDEDGYYTLDEKKQIARTFIEHIIVGDEQVEVVFH